MKIKFFRVGSIVLLVVLILALVTAIAGAIAKSNLAKKYPAPGQLVDVGGYRMHIYCTGQGSPTVILEAGTGDSLLTWSYVQPEITKSTHICSYDRASLGWSEESPYPRTANTQVEELHKLLVNANIQGPFVLVGHSLGGMLVRMYAHNYPDEVVGMVLVDSLHEERSLRNPELVEAVSEMTGQFRMFGFLSSSGILALAPQTIPNPGLPEDAYAQYQAIVATTRGFETILAELNAAEVSSAEARALHMTDFGELPLIVLSAGHGQSMPSFTDAENQHLWENLQIEQTELTALSSGGKQVMAEQSGHYIQLDQPDLVIDAIQEIVDALRKGD
jgi:pimeloyl-ACP methyl ester carboxylesterase